MSASGPTLQSAKSDSPPAYNTLIGLPAESLKHTSTATDPSSLSSLRLRVSNDMTLPLYSKLPSRRNTRPIVGISIELACTGRKPFGKRADPSTGMLANCSTRASSLLGACGTGAASTIAANTLTTNDNISVSFCFSWERHCPSKPAPCKLAFLRSVSGVRSRNF